MERPQFIKEIDQAFRNHPITAILGPRQCGKTTLAKMYASDEKKGEIISYFDLEDPADAERLSTPQAILSTLSGLIIIDEVQHAPELFRVLRVLVDEPNNNRKFLILGSASPLLLKQSSETLAGRIRYIELTPFNYQEVDHWQRLWVRGGFPKAYLANSDADSQDWRKGYIKTFLEQDIPNLGINIPARTLRRFWLMLAHYHGKIFNASEIGRSLGIADTTIRRYLDILSGTFMVRQLVPWLENLKKRQIKSPKIYFRDSGLYHTLLDIPDYQRLIHHPTLGNSWEGAALEEIIRHHQADPEECYFWGVHQQAELDLLIFKNGKRLGFEFKFSDAPKLTKSMITSMESLKLNSLSVIFPGKGHYALEKDINVYGIEYYLTR